MNIYMLKVILSIIFIFREGLNMEREKTKIKTCKIRIGKIGVSIRFSIYINKYKCVSIEHI